MGVIQRNTGTHSGTGSFNVTLPVASSSSNLVLVTITGNTVVSTPSGWTLRTSQVNFMGHYHWTRPGGASTYAFSASGQLHWTVEEIEDGVYGGALSQNSSSPAGTYSSPSITPTAGDRHVLADFGSTHSNTTRTHSGWTNSFTERYDASITTNDRPAHGYATREGDYPGGSTSTAITYSSNSSEGRTAIIAWYTTTTGGGAEPTDTTPTGVGTTVTLGAVATALGALATSVLGIGLVVTPGTPAAAPGAVETTPPGIGATATPGDPAAVTTVDTTPAGVGLAADAGTPTTATTLTTVPDGAALAATPGDPATTTTVTTTPSGIGLAATPGDPTTTTGTVATGPDGIALTATPGTPGTTAPALDTGPTGIPLTATTGDPGSTFIVVTTPDGAGLEARPGGPGATTGPVATVPDGIALTVTPGEPTAGDTSGHRDITVTATLDPRRWDATLTARDRTGTLTARRWEGRLT